MNYHPTDTFMQGMFPVLSVPKLGAFEEINRDGHRYLAAADGLWIEIRTAWLYCRQKIGPSSVAIPYGTITPEIRFLCQPIPKALIDSFVTASREASQNEIAAQIIWNRETGEIRLQFLDYTSNGPGHIDYLTPHYGASEVMVVDLHSHGCFGAFFSNTDDVDDAGQIKVAAVVGHCDRPAQSIRMRLCVLGMYFELPGPLYETKEHDYGTPA